MLEGFKVFKGFVGPEEMLERGLVSVGGGIVMELRHC